ncbi:MAG: hypothetical protein AAGF97_01445 [Planctomycetota bacterium]
MTRQLSTVLAIGVGLLVPQWALATVTISQVATPTTYSTTLNFDEPGGPSGIGLPDDAFLANGITALVAGDSNNVVQDNTGDGPWIGTGQSFFGNFGIFATFENDLSEFSANVWDPAGPPGPFGGGMGIFVFDDGVEVASSFITPAWGGIGDAGIEITTSGGMVFDEVRMLGFGFPATTYGDDFSWNVVPEPDGTIVFCLAAISGLICRRR